MTDVNLSSSETKTHTTGLLLILGSLNVSWAIQTITNTLVRETQNLYITHRGHVTLSHNINRSQHNIIIQEESTTVCIRVSQSHA